MFNSMSYYNIFSLFVESKFNIINTTVFLKFNITTNSQYYFIIYLILHNVTRNNASGLIIC